MRGFLGALKYDGFKAQDRSVTGNKDVELCGAGDVPLGGWSLGVEVMFVIVID
jgi:hypothetical protein